MKNVISVMEQSTSYTRKLDWKKKARKDPVAKIVTDQLRLAYPNVLSVTDLKSYTLSAHS